MFSVNFHIHAFLWLSVVLPVDYIQSTCDLLPEFESGARGWGTATFSEVLEINTNKVTCFFVRLSSLHTSVSFICSNSY